MPGDTPHDWTPVARDAVGILGQASDNVQITVTVALALIALAGIAAWFFSRRRPEDDSTVPATLMVNVTEEFSRQVAHMTTAVEGMAEIVEELRDTIKGCSTCPFHPNAKRN
ncbi:MAG: hypothetical protein Q7R40_17120 [Phaeospirillum sp.]|nr:hypothetical protein [Phaeospirillum sp.]